MATQNSMMLAERTDELLSRGRSQGFLSTEEVANHLQEGDLSAAEIEEFYVTLEEEEITIVEGEASENGGSRTTVATAVRVSEPPAVQIAHAVATGDSIRMYLAEIGRVLPLPPTDDIRHPSDLREVHSDGIPRGNGVGDLDRRRLRDAHSGGHRRPAPPVLGRLTLHDRYLFLFERNVELLYLRRREIPLLQVIGDLLCAEKALTSPPTQELVSSLRQHHRVLGRHLSPLLPLCAPTASSRTHIDTIVKSL